MIALVVVLSLLASAFSKCTSLEGDCVAKQAKFTSQFNVNWKGVPTYEDLLSNVYIRRDDCTVRTYTTLDHKRLTCEEIEKNKFQCDSVVESTWFRVWDAGAGSGILDSCGNQWYEQYQDVMKVPCIIDGYDFMKNAKMHVGQKSSVTLTIKNRIPEEYDGLHYGGECVWEYEIEGFWSTLVITIFAIAIGIALILIVLLYIYANKHRSEKRNNLNSSLVSQETKLQV